MTSIGAPPLAPPVASSSDRGLTFRLPLQSGENVYGLGLQMYSVNHRGSKKTLRVNADPRTDSGDSHAPVPLYVSSLGYAVFVDTARYATFCLGSSRTADESVDERQATYIADVVNLDPAASAFIRCHIDLARGVDVYVLGGPTMLEAVRRYNLFSGGGADVPEWGLGVWYRAHSDFDEKAVLKLVEEFRSARIPCDVIGLEPGWLSHAYPCSFEWSDRFPDPDRFIGRLSELGLRVNLWEHAFVDPKSPLHPALNTKSGNYLVWGGLVPDLCDPAARQTFGEYHRKVLIARGVSGFKLDECDNSDFTGGWSFPEFAQFPSGQDGEQMHSLFGVMYQATLLEQFRAAKLPTYSQVRSSGALASPYPFALYSDLSSHRVFVRALVNQGFSGLLWCPEVKDCESGEDLIRMLQTLVFSPMAQVNASGFPLPPWKQPLLDKNMHNVLDADWQKLQARAREILQWRMMLIPYLRGAFARYAIDGTPPFRAMVLETPSDPRFADCDDQYMVGDRMMVAPLFHGEDSRNVKIPKGAWHDFWTGQAVNGGGTIEVSHDYERIPVYLKTNSLLPIGEIAVSTNEPTTRELCVRVFGTGSQSFEIPNDGTPLLSLSWTGISGKVRQLKTGRQYRVTRWMSATADWITS